MFLDLVCLHKTIKKWTNGVMSTYKNIVLWVRDNKYKLQKYKIQIQNLISTINILRASIAVMVPRHHLQILVRDSNCYFAISVMLSAVL